MVGHDVGMPASFQHEDFLLKGGDIIICKERQEEKVAADRESLEGDPNIPASGSGVGKEFLGPLSPGSIFTIFSATRSPDTLSRAWKRGSWLSGSLHR